MIKTEPVMNLRKNLGEILNEVEYKHDTIIVTRAGKPSVAIIDIQLFEKIKSMRTRFSKLTSELQESFVNVKSHDIDNLINEATNKSRQK